MNKKQLVIIGLIIIILVGAFVYSQISKNKMNNTLTTLDKSKLGEIVRASGGCTGTLNCNVWSSNEALCTTNGSTQCSWTAPVSNYCFVNGNCGDYTELGEGYCNNNFDACRWDSGCSGTAQCDENYPESECLAFGGTFDQICYCPTPALSCSDLSEFNCDVLNEGSYDCTWSAGSNCVYNNACEGITPQEDCESIGGGQAVYCSWGGGSASSCNNVGSCSAETNETICGGLIPAGCSWGSGDCWTKSNNILTIPTGCIYKQNSGGVTTLP